MKKRIFVIAGSVAAAAVIFALGFETADEHYNTESRSSGFGSITLSVSCEELVDNDSVDSNLKNSGIIPADGIIIPETKYPIEKGDSAFDVLELALKERKILFDYTSISDRSAYVRGINNIYEYDCGDLSGWMYSVNGDFPTLSSSEYILSDGDNVRWMYTCDLGRDVGDTYSTRNNSGESDE